MLWAQVLFSLYVIEYLSFRDEINCFGASENIKNTSNDSYTYRIEKFDILFPFKFFVLNSINITSDACTQIKMLQNEINILNIR